MRHLALILLICLVSLSYPTVGAAEEYLLGDQDRVFLRAGRWNTEKQLFEYWDGISGEYTVSPDGMLSISLIGDVRATGRSTAEIADEIALSFQREIGLPARPSVSLEIAAYKPIYVGGAVNAPGAYP